MRAERKHIWLPVAVLLICLLGCCAGCASGTPRGPSLFQALAEELPRSGQEPEPRVILLTLSEQEGTFAYQCAVHFKELLEGEKTGFAVDIYPQNTLSTMETSDKTLYDGRIQMRLGPGPSKLLQLMALPTLSGVSAGELPKLMEDPQWQALLEEECQSYRVRVMGLLPANERMVSSTRPLTTVEDFRGLRMRYSGSEYTVAIYRPLGTDLTRVAMEGSYAALHNRFVEAWTDNTLFHYLDEQRYLQQPFVNMVHQQIYVEAFYVSQVFYDSLTELERDALDRTVAETIAWAGNRFDQITREGEHTMEKYGATVLELPPEEQRRMDQMVYDSIYQYMLERIGSEELMLRALRVLHALK